MFKSLRSRLWAVVALAAVAFAPIAAQACALDNQPATVWQKADVAAVHMAPMPLEAIVALRSPLLQPALHHMNVDVFNDGTVYASVAYHMLR